MDSPITGLRDLNVVAEQGPAALWEAANKARFLLDAAAPAAPLRYKAALAQRIADATDLADAMEDVK